ncbi:20841_t:CDS:2 [Entrophospora sp. SA101]|nr:20841_t:CDS:2 [Entrophospora sp. SA101]
MVWHAYEKTIKEDVRHAKLKQKKPSPLNYDIEEIRQDQNAISVSAQTDISIPKPPIDSEI